MVCVGRDGDRKTEEICWNEEEKEENKKRLGTKEKKMAKDQERLHGMTSREIQTSMAAHMANITYSTFEVLQY